MKIIPNVLSEDLISSCRREVDERIAKNESCWISSTVDWPQNLKEGIRGSCLSSPTSKQINKNIIKEISPHLPPKVNKINTRYNIWQYDSGIAMHDDSNKVFGATIYMNYEWHPNGGGWFIWEDKNDGEWKVLLPTFNTMVLNTNKEQHLVTPVVSNKLRTTIQIWGMEK